MTFLEDEVGEETVWKIEEEIDKFIIRNFRSIFDPSQASVAHLISGEL